MSSEAEIHLPTSFLGDTFYHIKQDLENVGRMVPSITIQVATFNAPYGRQPSKVVKGWSGISAMASGAAPASIIIDRIDESDRENPRALRYREI